MTTGRLCLPAKYNMAIARLTEVDNRLIIRRAMDKRLNLAVLQNAMDKAGFNPAAIARELSVSREAVSKWFAGRSLPRPDKLLKLALLLGLTFDQIVIREAADAQPVVAFRKRGASKTTERHIAHAMEIGHLLKPLVPFLPFDQLARPSTLKSPSRNYEYLQTLVLQIRREIGIGATDVLDFRHLIKRFTDLQTVLIPVLWGRKEKHENALHIYLPDSMTTWVYLNLDVEVHDFKFWMAHEFGHVLAPTLGGDEGEDFADDFAATLLYPEALAEKAHARLSGLTRKDIQVNRIKDIAEEHLISPITVYLEVNRYAQHHNRPPLDLGNGIFGAAKNLSKAYRSVSESVFETSRPSAKAYINFARELGSPFFEVLKTYLVQTGKGAGYVQSVLDVPLLDARELHAELV